MIHNGNKFSVQIEGDDIYEAPWEREDSHGVISERVSRSKRSGELVLSSDRGSHRYYDVAETIKIATRDGWGLAPEKCVGMTPRQIVAEAVRQDFERMRAWCRDEWSYVGVVVTHIETGKVESLWGIESDCEDYLDEVACELADQILYEIDAETVEAAHWANKNLITV